MCNEYYVIPVCQTYVPVTGRLQSGRKKQRSLTFGKSVSLRKNTTGDLKMAPKGLFFVAVFYIFIKRGLNACIR
jgi:hypothetical protein